MKKIYVKPSVEMMDMEVQDMIAASPGTAPSSLEIKIIDDGGVLKLSNSETTGEVWADSKGNGGNSSVWDD